jgi:hypothetical protein
MDIPAEVEGSNQTSPTLHHKRDLQVALPLRHLLKCLVGVVCATTIFCSECFLRPIA